MPWLREPIWLFGISMRVWLLVCLAATVFLVVAAIIAAKLFSSPRKN